MFRNRQFWLVLVTGTPVATLPVCGQSLPGLVASLVPCHGAAGCGGRQRSAPTGGAAYGMPRNSLARPVRNPLTRPSRVPTTSGSNPDPARPAAAAPGPAIPQTPTTSPAATSTRPARLVMVPDPAIAALTFAVPSHSQRQAGGRSTRPPASPQQVRDAVTCRRPAAT